jgi:hypothetical protein
MSGGDDGGYERGRRVRKASKWVGILAILFAVSAPILYEQEQTKTASTLAALNGIEDGQVLRPIGGRIYTAGELRQRLESLPRRVLAADLILAGLMAGLWVWARRSPLPAIACALAMFVVVQVVGGIYSPASIFEGLLVKIFALVALIKGLRSALEARAALRTPPA